MTVFLVDDEPTMRKMVKLMLEKRGFQVFDAASGADALALSEQHPVELLVTDVVMEPMDGRALARTLVERQPDLPVLFISGVPIDAQAERQHCPRCGFLPKPFQPRELIQAIADLSPACS